jgi:hypothetical protein
LYNRLGTTIFLIGSIGSFWDIGFDDWGWG